MMQFNLRRNIMKHPYVSEKNPRTCWWLVVSKCFKDVGSFGWAGGFELSNRCFSICFSKNRASEQKELFSRQMMIPIDFDFDGSTVNGEMSCP